MRLLENPDQVQIAPEPDPKVTAYMFLRGKNWNICTNCDGTGWYYNYVYRPEETTLYNGLQVRGSACNICEGTGGYYK